MHHANRVSAFRRELNSHEAASPLNACSSQGTAALRRGAPQQRREDRSCRAASAHRIALRVLNSERGRAPGQSEGSQFVGPPRRSAVPLRPPAVRRRMKLPQGAPEQRAPSGAPARRLKLAPSSCIVRARAASARGLTPRSRRHATACVVSPVCASSTIVTHRAYAARLRVRLTSNVRPHNRHPCVRATRNTM